MEAVMVAVFAFLVSRAEITTHYDTQAPNEPVYHNYNGGFTK